MADAARVAREGKHPDPTKRDQLADDYARQAVGLLRKAIQEGYRDRVHMDRDADLDPLRRRADFQAVLAELDRRSPSTPPTAAQQLQFLQREVGLAQAAYAFYQQRAQSVAEKKRAQTRMPRVEPFAERFLQFAQAHRDSPSAVQALMWVLENTRAPAGGRQTAQAKLRQWALEALERDHFQKPEMADVCQRLAETPAPDFEKLLRAAVARHKQRDVQGLAGYALALSLARQAEQARATSTSEADALSRKAEEQLEQLVKDHASITLGQTTLGEAAREKLYELRHLTVGRVAPEIDGEDLAGKRFKLSDYRGKVVVLDFWANWCGFCRDMYPHERQLVTRLKARPFALLGVNCDEDRAEIRRVVDKEKLNWKSWWDGGTERKISTPWQVTSFPTIYVLDHKGVIRYKGVRGQRLDAAVNHLLKECETGRKKGETE
jgi:thiol-disulfide isomerase/thioredoxin